MDSLATTAALSSTGLLRDTKTTTLNGNHLQEFVQNDLISTRYETLPIQSGNARMPGYTGHVPGSKSCYAQRKAQASMHTDLLQPMTHATKGGWQDMQLVDMRAEERAYNKNHCYAENTKTMWFMQFPTKKTFDPRRM